MLMLTDPCILAGSNIYTTMVRLIGITSMPKDMKPKGWLKIGGKWYFLNNDPDDDDGWMYSDCWSDIDGACYRFDTSGAMHIGWYKHIFSDGTYDWYYYNSDGKEQRGWLKLGTKWYYLDTNDGWMYRDGVEIIDGINYGFDANGVMLTGWCKRTYGMTMLVLIGFTLMQMVWDMRAGYSIKVHGIISNTE